MPQVGFDNTFFARSLNDYSNWIYSFVRESMQNCIDCGSDRINYHIEYDDNHVTVIFSNNGEPMGYSTLTDKLMNIGGTTKSGDDGQVGGFGVAKIVLYMSHDSYEIQSGDWTIIGSGGNYDIKKTERFDGTRSIIKISNENPKSLAEKLYGQLLRFAGHLQWDGSLFVTYQNEPEKLIGTSLRKGFFRKEFSFGRLYTNKSYNNLLIFRINGIPMFTKHVSYNGCVIFEATLSSTELMTSNRDGLKWSYQSEIEDVIRRFSTNRSSVLNPEPTIEVFGNTLLSIEFDTQSNKSKGECVDEELIDEEPIVENAKRYQEKREQNESGLYIAARQNETEDERGYQEYYKKPTNIGYSKRFMILNETGMTTPTHTMPGLMSEYCKKLAKTWSNLMCEVYRLNNVSGMFAVGFCLGDAIAKCATEDGVTYYLINPFKIVEQESSKSRSFKKRYNFSKDRENLIMSAVHEFIHGAYGNNYSYHDEDYAAKLTSLAAVALKNRKQLIKAFKTNV